MKKDDLFLVRDKINEDESFIYATWLRSLRHGNEWFSLIDQTTYYKVYHNVIEAVLNNPSISIKIACLKEDPSVILGYAVFSLPQQRLDWVFVKKVWRKIGIAKGLVPEGIKVVSHLTNDGKKILSKHTDVKFNPFNVN